MASLDLRGGFERAGSDLAMPIFHPHGGGGGGGGGSTRRHGHHDDDDDDDQDIVMVSFHPHDGSVHQESSVWSGGLQSNLSSVNRATANAIAMMLSGPDSLDDELDPASYVRAVRATPGGSVRRMLTRPRLQSS